MTWSTYYHKGETLLPLDANGDSHSCKDWADYAVYDLKLPFDHSQYGHMTVYQQTLDFATGENLTQQITCTNIDVVNDIAFALNTGGEYNDVCVHNSVGIRYLVGTCPGVGTAMCVGCNDVCKTTSSCYESVLTTKIRANPCQQDMCEASPKAYYQIVTFGVIFKALYPDIIGPINATVGRTTVDLSIEVDGDNEGVVYCDAVPISSPNLTSAISVKLSDTSISYTVSDFAWYEDPIIAMTLTGLSPDSEYNVYCYSEDYAAHASELTVVLSTVVNVKTLCCPEVTFSEVSHWVRMYLMSTLYIHYTNTVHTINTLYTH